MAEGRTGRMEIASPLYSEGVHHAEVTSPVWGVDIPDPMGFLAASPPSVDLISRGSGDQVNDWKDEFPDESS